NFIIIGDGVAKTALEAAMPNAHFLGHINHERLSVLYASADVFLFPSDTESYGNVVVEAMASGLPCVIANGGGSGSLVEHGINGFTCPPRHPLTYLQYIEQLLNNNNLRQQIIDNGLTYARQLDWDRLADRYFDELSALCDEPIPVFI
ncbi:MAG: glycosyltransferase, partial [Bacteroidota bacterium]